MRKAHFIPTIAVNAVEEEGRSGTAAVAAGQDAARGTENEEEDAFAEIVSVIRRV